MSAIPNYMNQVGNNLYIYTTNTALIGVPQYISVTVTDPYSTQTIAIIINIVNSPPKFTVAPPTSITIHANMRSYYTVTDYIDDNGDSVTVQMDSLSSPSWASNVGVDLTFYPVGFVGTTSFTFALFDGFDSSGSFTISLVVINDPPVF